MVTDWTEKENELLLECGAAGGEYLDSIGKTDLAKLSKGEWLQFLQCIGGLWAPVVAAKKSGRTRRSASARKDEFNDYIPF